MKTPDDSAKRYALPLRAAGYGVPRSGPYLSVPDWLGEEGQRAFDRERKIAGPIRDRFALAIREGRYPEMLQLRERLREHSKAAADARTPLYGPVAASRMLGIMINTEGHNHGWDTKLFDALGRGKKCELHSWGWQVSETGGNEHFDLWLNEIEGHSPDPDGMEYCLLLGIDFGKSHHFDPMLVYPNVFPAGVTWAEVAQRVAREAKWRNDALEKADRLYGLIGVQLSTLEQVLWHYEVLGYAFTQDEITPANQREEALDRLLPVAHMGVAMYEAEPHRWEKGNVLEMMEALAEKAHVPHKGRTSGKGIEGAALRNRMEEVGLYETGQHGGTRPEGATVRSVVALWRKVLDRETRNTE